MEPPLRYPAALLRGSSLKESETSFAVVGEYRGEILIEDGNVFFDCYIIGFKDGVTKHGLENRSIAYDI